MTHITQLTTIKPLPTPEPEDFRYTYRILKQLSATPTTVAQLMFKRGIKQSHSGSAAVRQILHWAATQGLVQFEVQLVRGKVAETFTITPNGEQWLNQNWTQFNSQINPTMHARWQALNGFRTREGAMDVRHLRRLVKLGLVWENPELRGQFRITHAGLDWLKAHDHLYAPAGAAA